MIYLFSSDPYGRSFREEAERFCREAGAQVTLVVSVRARKPKRLRDRLLAPLRRVRFRFAEARRVRRLTKLPFVLEEDVNSPGFRARIGRGDHAIVAGFNQIFKQPIIDRFASIVNFHPSVLPLYRGPVPSYWCIQNGERATGFTLHRISARIDDGEILHQGRVAIGDTRDPAAVDLAVARAAAPVLRRYLEHLRDHRAWVAERLDAREIYRTHVDYASFPSAPGAAR